MRWDRIAAKERKNIDDRRFDEPVEDDRLLAGLPQTEAQFERQLQRIREHEAYRQRIGARNEVVPPIETRQPTNVGRVVDPSFDRVRELVGAPPSPQQSRVQLVGEDAEALVYRDHTGREIRIPKSIVGGR